VSKYITTIILILLSSSALSAELNIYAGIGTPFGANNNQFKSNDVGYLAIEVKQARKWSGVFYKAEHRSMLSDGGDKGSNLFIFGGYVSLLQARYMLADELNIYFGLGTPFGANDEQYDGFDVRYLAVEITKEIKKVGIFYKIERRVKLSENGNKPSNLFVIGLYYPFEIR